MNVSQSQGSNDRIRKRRAACDQCHSAKVKCPGGENPCQRCAQNALPCHYSFAARMGKPRGSKNKKTLERMQAVAANPEVHVSVPNDLQRESILEQDPNQTSNGKVPPQQSQNQLQTDEDVNGLESSDMDTLLDINNMLGRDATSAAGESSNLGYGVSTESNENTVEGTSDPFTFPNTSLNGIWEFPTRSLSSAHLDSQFNFDEIAFSESAYSSPPPRTKHSNSLDSLGAIAAGLDRSAEFDIDIDNDLMNNRGSFSIRPQTTPSSSSAASSTVSSTNGHFPSLAPLFQQSCQCYKSQTSSLCYLRRIEQRQSPMKVDMVLNCTRLVAAAAENQTACQVCRSEPNPIPTLHLTLMTFQPIFRWARALSHHPDLPCPDMEIGTGIRMGTYEVQKEEEDTIKSLLVAREYEKMHRALLKVRARVDVVAAEVNRRGSQRDRQRDLDWDCERGEVQNLLGLSQNLLQTSTLFARRLRAKKS